MTDTTTDRTAAQNDTEVSPFRGNHFAAWQEPELFPSEVRAAFRSLR